MTPKRYYRYGVASEKRLFDEVVGSSDGFVLPAHLVVDQRDSLSPWLAGKEYCIDPMTHVWFSEECNIANTDGSEFKRSYRKIRDEYDSVFLEATEPGKKLDIAGFLASARSDGGRIDEMITAVLNYQLSFVDRVCWDNEIQEYIDILRSSGFDTKGLDIGMKQRSRILPCRVILPYVYFTNMGTAEYEINKAIWNRAIKLYEGDVPLHALIATDDPAIDWQSLVDDLGDCIQGVTLWFSDVDEATAQKDQLVDIRRACRILHDGKLEVCIHSGGAFAMGLAYDGLKAMSSGITYGERRPAALVEGGPVPQRYFIPQLLRNYALGEATFALKKLGIECTNPCCRGIRDVDELVQRFFPGGETSWGPVESVKRHYLYSFRQKTSDIWSAGKNAGVDVLTLMQQYAAARTPSSYWKHLETWISAYEEPL